MTPTFNQDKVDEMILALMYLTAFNNEFGVSSWKSYDWDSLNRLHSKGFISNPVSKAKSVSLSPEGRVMMETLFKKHFES